MDYLRTPLSFFVVSNNKKFNNYDMTINYGFGTGKIGSDSHNYNDTGGQQ